MTTHPAKPPGALIPLPHLVRGTATYRLHAVPGSETVFRVTGPDGRSADGPTPDDALTALRNRVTAVAAPAPMFSAWLIPRVGDRLVQRAWIADRAEKRGSMLIYPRDAEDPSPDNDTRSTPRLWGSEHVYLDSGLAPGELCAPRLISGESLALYRTDDAARDRTSVWADLFHADDPRVPALRKAIAHNLARRAIARHLTTEQLAVPAWRPFPTMQEIDLHAARSGGAGVWAFRERTRKARKDAVLFTLAVAEDSTQEAPRVVNENGLALPCASYTAARGEWRPVSRRTLGPLPWPEAPLAPGDTVLAFAPTIADRDGKVMTVVAINAEARTVLLQTINSRPDRTRQRAYPLSAVKLLARASA
jgi:hypothetical protein